MMRYSKDDAFRFKYGTPVRLKPGVVRKAWEWIGHVHMVSGDRVAVVWRIALPDSNGQRPITHRLVTDLEVIETVQISIPEE